MADSTGSSHSNRDQRSGRSRFAYLAVPAREALIDRIYDQIYTWNPDWEKLIADRAVLQPDRLVAFYRAYAQTPCCYAASSVLHRRVESAMLRGLSE
ncbi:hypothetical protein [Burkholderia ubonensis]|uniref:hypothetical protein n=1 Tax=Burkholderia ubonensis TaxID=101571 RepID=UPI0021AA57C4|nr:hypothetical protein [Burkholderia ubonensis]